MADLDLPALKALCEKATPGPWVFGLNKYDADKGDYCVVPKPFDYEGPGYSENPYIIAPSGDNIVGCDEYYVFSCPADIEFITTARTALPLLVEEVERLRAALAEREPVLTAEDVPLIVEGALHALRALGDTEAARKVFGDKP